MPNDEDEERASPEGHPPSLKHNISEDLRSMNLTLTSITEQKPRQTRDKNPGRKVISDHKEDRHQEVIQMPEHHAVHSEVPGVIPTINDVPGDKILAAIEMNGHEMHLLRKDFGKSTSYKAEATRFGMTTAAVAFGMFLGGWALSYVIPRGEPELPAGTPKK